MDMAIYSSSTQAMLCDELAQFVRRLQEREDAVRLAAAEAILSGNDSDAGALLRQIREISSFRRNINTTLAPLMPLKIEPKQENVSTPVSTTSIVLPEHGLRVVNIGGKQISGHSDAATFANAVQEIGCARVAKLGLFLNYVPLVSKELHKLSHQRYHMQTESRGGWFIVTHSSTKRKRELLKRICRGLGLSFKIEPRLN